MKHLVLSRENLFYTIHAERPTAEIDVIDRIICSTAIKYHDKIFTSSTLVTLKNFVSQVKSQT